MMFWVVGFCVVFLVVLGGMLSGAAFGSYRRGLDWPDIAAIAGSLLALLVILVFLLFLAWPLALLLAIGVVAVSMWGLGFLVKRPERRRPPNKTRSDL
jgi:lysylphosphatidylglycerol synthetase-like protein (DUF2156 family)